MRSWAYTLVPIALTSVFATGPYSPSRDPSWDASAQRVRRRSKGQSMFSVRSLGRSSRAGFGSVALLPSRNSVAAPFADVHRGLTLPARKPRSNRPSRGYFFSSRDLSNWRPAPGADAWFGCQRRASSSSISSISSSNSSSSSSSSRRRGRGSKISSSSSGTSTRRNSSSSSSSSSISNSSNSSNNGENTAGTSGSHANANADNQRAAQDDATTTVTPYLGSSTNNTKNALLASWPASLSPTNTGKLYVSEVVGEAAQWLELHGVVDPEPSAAELLAKAARYRSPQDMSSRLRVASLCYSTSWNVSPSLEMTPAEWDEMRRLCELRAAQHVPVQYLVGEWDFYGLSLEMRPPTLIPRPETEELVDRVLQWVRQEGIETANNNGLVGGGGGSSGGSAGCGGGGGGDGVGGGGGNGGGVGAGLQFLDVGSGSGAIGLTLLKELPEARCVAIDAQPAAVRLSRRNAERTGLQPQYSCFHAKIADFGGGFGAGAGYGFEAEAGFGAGFGERAGNGTPTSAEDDGKIEASRAEVGGVGRGGGEGGGTFDGSFDFIVSNPPYIPKSDMEALPPDVADHEDSVALDGGEDGLDVVRDIVRRCPRLLRRGGPRELWMEVDTSHPEAMQRWLGLAAGGGAVQECAAHGVTRFEWMSDMSQRPRFVRLTFAEDDGVAEGEEGEGG